MASANTVGPIQRGIQAKLAALKPSFLSVDNESNNHNVPRGSESHFRVVIVSEEFEGKPLLARHRLVNATLAEELRQHIHALSIVAKTPKQWAESQAVSKSPACLGGGGRKEDAA